jgi:hypothetical protein
LCSLDHDVDLDLLVARTDAPPAPSYLDRRDTQLVIDVDVGPYAGTIRRRDFTPNRTAGSRHREDAADKSVLSSPKKSSDIDPRLREVQMTSARLTVIMAAVIAALVLQPGFAMSKTFIVMRGPITKSKPVPSINSTPRSTTKQNSKIKSGQTVGGHSRF